MAEPRTEPRRENGITVRYLAQTIINRVTFPDGSGIDAFIRSLVNHHNVGKDAFTNLKYYFFLHLEDYRTDDKTEIDFILWNERVIIPVEVKAFTDANSPDVKREIVRNTIHVEAIIKNLTTGTTPSAIMFNKDQTVYPVLLYSRAYQSFKRAGNAFDYFNESFLLTTGRDQRHAMEKWDAGGYKLPSKYLDDDIESSVSKINHRLFFTTWENILEIHQALNTDGRLTETIDGLRNARDTQQDSADIPLVLPSG